jgi:hypothetical protein
LPWTAEQIDLDIDVRELQGQQQLDMLCGFLHAIGAAARQSPC